MIRIKKGITSEDTLILRMRYSGPVKGSDSPF
jgi:hypothetical protein